MSAFGELDRELSMESKADPTLHWLPGVERRGLGNAVVRVNHIALIVSDVGRSAAFYSDVIGLQQITRPNFDRHGAWFTMGNCELHLIKGPPLVHSGRNLIVCHISLDVRDTSEVLQKLSTFGIPFEQNVSVPKGMGKAASEGGSQDNTLTQFFIRDPDGYYLELCNCDILTDFCFNRIKCPKRSQSVHLYHEGKPDALARHLTHVSFATLVRFVMVVARKVVEWRTGTLEEHHRKLLEAAAAIPPAAEVDATVLANLVRRRMVYGDVVQSFSEDEIKELLVKANNHAPTCILMMMDQLKKGLRAEHFQPPGYYKFDGVHAQPNGFYRPSMIDSGRNSNHSSVHSGLNIVA